MLLEVPDRDSVCQHYLSRASNVTKSCDKGASTLRSLTDTAYIQEPICTDPRTRLCNASLSPGNQGPSIETPAGRPKSVHSMHSMRCWKMFFLRSCLTACKTDSSDRRIKLPQQGPLHPPLVRTRYGAVSMLHYSHGERISARRKFVLVG